MEYHFKIQLQFENALRKNEQGIKTAREVDEHLFADKWLLVQALLNQATIILTRYWPQSKTLKHRRPSQTGRLNLGSTYIR